MSNEHTRLPAWMKKKRWNEEFITTRKILRKANLNTVCESARCPNIGECFSKPTATFMIMGTRCTRNCFFCAIENGKPEKLDSMEPERIAQVVRDLSLKHVVITSVTRDDLPLDGADHFAKTIEAIKKNSPNVTIEVLTPDFQHNRKAIEKVLELKPDVFNHNMETVSRLYPSIRPEANYKGSLNILSIVNKNTKAKSGFMLGLGESMDEVEALMKDIRDTGCEMLTIGQYLRPSKKNVPVVCYIPPEQFDRLGKLAESMGFTHAFSAPFARSSFHAEKKL